MELDASRMSKFKDEVCSGSWLKIVDEIADRADSMRKALYTPMVKAATRVLRTADLFPEYNGS
jgi:hypothetical protein